RFRRRGQSTASSGPGSISGSWRTHDFEESFDTPHRRGFSHPSPLPLAGRAVGPGLAVPETPAGGTIGLYRLGAPHSWSPCRPTRRDSVEERETQHPERKLRAAPGPSSVWPGRRATTPARGCIDVSWIHPPYHPFPLPEANVPLYQIL